MSVRFQRPARPLTARDYQYIVLVVLLFVIAASSLVFLNLELKGGGGEFYLQWTASRAFLFDKIEPYSGDVVARTQALTNAKAAVSESPYYLGTPFHLLPLYFLFALLPDPVVARAIFRVILEAALLAVAYFSLRLTDWEPNLILSALFTSFAVLNYYSLQAVYAASPVLLVGLLYAGILMAMRAELDELTGALIALSMFSSSAGAPFLILIILRLYREQRTAVLAGFLMLSGVLLAISFLLYPGWIVPFLRASINNMHAEHGLSVLMIAGHLWPGGGRTVAWIGIGALLLLLGFEWTSARAADFRRFYWISCLTIAISPLFGIRTEMDYLCVYLVPLALVLAVAHDRWRGVRAGLVKVFLLVLVFAVPWAIYFFAADAFGATKRELLFLFLPVFTVAGLYWIRWWAIQPPRTWRDMANRI